MDVKGTPSFGKSQQQAAWAVLVVRVVFDNLSPYYRLAQFRHGDMAQDALINSVFENSY